MDRVYSATKMDETFEVRCPYSGEVRFYGNPGDYLLFDEVSKSNFGVSADNIVEIG